MTLAPFQTLLFLLVVAGGLFGFGYWLRPRAARAARFIWLHREPPHFVTEAIKVAAKLYMFTGLIMTVVFIVAWVRGEL